MPDRFERVIGTEIQFLTVGSSLSGAMTCAPYQVIAAGYWEFARTNPHEGDLFGKTNQSTYVFPGASGHETDKIDANSPVSRDRDQGRESQRWG
jgi:hypothetical protein